MAININLGASLGLTVAHVSMSGSGLLNYSQIPGTGSLGFYNSGGTAEMNVGFQTWAKYQFSYKGSYTSGDLPILPNLDLLFADEKQFDSYMLGQSVTLSDTIDDVPIVSVGIGTKDVGLPEGIADLTLGISVTPTLQCSLHGVELQTSAGAIHSANDQLGVDLRLPSLTITDISQTTHCDVSATISPNVTVEVTIIGFQVFDGKYPTGTPFTISLGGTDIVTTPPQNIAFDLQATGVSSAPVISSVSPLTLLASSVPQPVRIYGSGFTGSSTLLFTGAKQFTATSLRVASPNEIDYDLVADADGTWQVQVANGSQKSNVKSFTVKTAGPTTGSLQVTLGPDAANLAGAQWQVDNTGYNLSGRVVGYLTPGSHQVTFKEVAGYTTPASQSATIVAGQQTAPPAFTYTAIAPSTYTLTLSGMAGQGGIAISPVGPGGGNTYTYSAGAIVQLTPSAASGYHFVSWGGDVTGSANPTTITMDRNKTVSANFATGDPNMGTVTVTIQPPEAAAAGVKWGWNADDYRDSGTSVTTSPGTYILTIHPVAGWLGPVALWATVTAGQTKNYPVQFTQDTTPGLLTVTISPSDAVTAGAKWRVNGGAAEGNGSSITLAPGTYTVAFDSVPGWTAPAGQIVTVSRGQTTIVNGTYSPPAGQPMIGSVSPQIAPPSGGTLVTINGANFAVPATVIIGGQSASNVVVSSATQITCLTPPSTNYGSASVVVQTRAGNATNANAFAYGLPNGNKIDLLGSIGGSCFAVAVQGNYAYVGEGRNMLVLDVTSPSTPSKIGHIALPGIVRAIALFQHYAYVAAEEGGVQVVDISNPAIPTIRGAYRTSDYSWTDGIAIFGGRAYVANENLGLQILDLGNPAIPSLISATNIGDAEAVVVKATANGTFAYVSTAGNLCVVDVSNPVSPRLRGHASINGGSCYSLAVSGNYAFAASLFGNLEIIDVSNPNSPSDIGHAPGAYFVTSVGIANNYVYAASSINGKGFYVFSLNGGTLIQIGNVPQCSADGYNMAISGTTAYVPDRASGVKVVSVSSPNSPSQLTSFNDSGIFRQYNSVAVTLNSMAACGYPEGTVVGFNSIFDVGNPSSPVFTANPNAGGSFVLARNGIAYVLAGNSNAVFNIATPASPQLLKLFSNTAVPGVSMALADNVLYIVGLNEANQPHLAVVDVSSPSSPLVKGSKDFMEINSGGATAIGVCGTRGLVGIQVYDTPLRYEVISLDLSNLALPVERGVYTNLTSYATGIEMSSDGNVAFVLGGGQPSTLSVLDVGQPALISLVTNVLIDPAGGSGLKLSGNELLVSTFRGVYAFDVSNSRSPVLTRSYQLSQAQALSVSSESVSQTGNIFVADLDGGLVILHEQDTQLPQVFITNPWSLPVFTNTNASIDVGGSSDDNIGVTGMTWSNNRGGSGQVSSPLDDWYVSGIPLLPGTNILTMTAFDAAGNSGSDTLTVVYLPPKQDQTITFRAVTDHVFGDAAIQLVAAASSGLPIKFSVVSGPASVDANGVLTLLGAGAVTVEATQGGNAAFNAAPPVDMSFNVARADQSIAFALLPDKSAGDPPFSLTATASSGLLVTFSVLSGPATLDSKNTVTLLGAGTVTIAATQAGDANYNPATTVQQSFKVTPIPQFIAFGTLSRQTVGDAPFSLAATASSGLPVSFSLLAGPAVLSGKVLTLAGPGLVSVRASQDGNAIYAAAAPVDQTVLVTPLNQAIGDTATLADGRFSFKFYADPGQTAVVDTSTDLVIWIPAITNTVNGLGELEFVEASASGGQRFFRVRLP